MSMLYDLDVRYYSELLAAGRMEIKDSQWRARTGPVAPDANKRSILIGLGGEGVKTIDQVKGILEERLQPSWRSHIAFLAIDTDDWDLEDAVHLTREEMVRASRPGIQTAVSKGKVAYPNAWHSFVDPDAVRTMAGFDFCGAGGNRLMGRMKLHFKQPGCVGVDEEIVRRLREIKYNVLLPFPGGTGGVYDVYVICGISGGTGGGGFLELPALIRRALNTDAFIHAMLYLPDTIMGKCIERSEQWMANGYAALKELDYYEGLSMRAGGEERFPYNDPAQLQLRLTSDDDMYTIPWLIGTRSGATASSREEARQTVIEYFLGLLCGGREPALQEKYFLHDVLGSRDIRFIDENNPNLEASGSDHSRPKRYTAMGVARASAPEELLRAYTIAQVCREAGLIRISEEERSARIAAGDALLPWRTEEQFITVPEVNVHSEQLLSQLNSYMSSFRAPRFTYADTFGSDPDWEEIRSGEADDPARIALVEGRVEKMTGIDAYRRLKEEIVGLFEQFRNAVMAYVVQNGPMAFVNLYEGHAERNGDVDRAIGIRERLMALKDDLDIETGVPRGWPHATDAQKRLTEARNVIMNERGGLMLAVYDAFDGRKARQAADWVAAFNRWVSIRISDELLRHLLGVSGILNRCFVEPAELLCRQLYTFGRLLTEMAEGYEYSSVAMEHFADFQQISEGSNHVNAAALSGNSYGWLHHRAKRIAANVNHWQLRNDLVSSFFGDPAQWLEVDENTIERWAGSRVHLVRSEQPIPARYAFDRCLSRNMPPFPQTSIQDLFKASGLPANIFARQLVRQLDARSGPLFYGSLNSSDVCRYILYPRGLQTELRQAIEWEAQCPCYFSDSTDTVIMYCVAGPFELYHLAELKEWEKVYLERSRSLYDYLHGMSPDVVMEQEDICRERSSWLDYPAITYSRDPKARDAVTGEISHEGKVRIRMDKVISEARKKGILYSHRTRQDTWVIRQVRLDPGRRWSFDAEKLSADPDTGMLPEGRELLEAILAMNGSTIQDCSQVVRLAYAGQLSREHSDEMWAWEYASRVLYAHRPMFHELRDTIEMTDPWFEAVEERNLRVRRFLDPARMYRLIQAGILSPDEKGTWRYRDEGGRQVAIAGMSPAKLELLRNTRPLDAAVIDAGLTLCYLFDQLMKYITGEELEEAMERATEILGDDEYLESEAFLAANKLAETALNTELGHLTAMGWDPETQSGPTEQFLRELEARRICGDERREAIASFYRNVRYWKKL